MKKFFIFFILFFTINSFSIYKTKNLIEGYLKGINETFSFGENCMSEKLDEIFNEMYNNCANYFYEVDGLTKTRYLMHVLINIAQIRSEISNCTIPDITNYGLFIGQFLVVGQLLQLNQSFLKKNWKQISEFVEELFKIYYSKNLDYKEFGLGFYNFVTNVSRLYSSNN